MKRAVTPEERFLELVHRNMSTGTFLVDWFLPVAAGCWLSVRKPLATKQTQWVCSRPLQCFFWHNSILEVPATTDFPSCFTSGCGNNITERHYPVVLSVSFLKDAYTHRAYTLLTPVPVIFLALLCFIETCGCELYQSESLSNWSRGVEGVFWDGDRLRSSCMLSDISLMPARTETQFFKRIQEI